MPVIPGTQEAEIRRITIGRQTGQKFSETPSQLMTQAWWITTVIPAIQEG
jgi:hypothetical protein